MNRFSVIVCLLLVAPSAWCQVSPPLPKTLRNGTMLVLRMKKTGDRFEILSRRTMSTTRTFRALDRGDFAIALLGPDGAPVWKEAFNDPSPRLEYEDPSHPGRLIRVPDTTRSITFTLRLPYPPAVQAVEVSRLTQPLGASAATEQKLGRMVLP